MGEQIIFGDWLRQRRKELGISQEELADRIGVSFAMLRKLESGERRPSGQIAYLLADYFSVPSDEHEAFVTFARAGHANSISSAQVGVKTNTVAAHAPWRSTYMRQTNLPVVLTPLIGRDIEVASARHQLLNSKVRLLSLTGPPGIGKTRVALRVASGLVDHFEDGVFFVDLAPIVDPDMVLPAVARSLDLREVASRAIESVLLDYAQERKMLLLLDNFEQVLDASPQLVKLLQAGPWLKVLLTSREALNVRGEKVFSIPPLSLPDLGQRQSPEVLAGYSSVALFTERAQAVAPGFELNAENAEDVAAICVGLEGMPLTIELAAARARHFSPRELRSALNSRLKLLTGGGQDLPPRQRTLKSAIEWSYDLLSVEEQRLFRRLGVFVGGCALEAIEAIGNTGHEGERHRARSTVEMLLSLVDKNLVRRESPVGQAGAARFDMLESIREYALAKLRESGEAEVVARAHALYFMRLVEEAEPALTGRSGEGNWLTRLDSEHENLLAALLWARALAVGEKSPRASGDDTSKEVEAPGIALRTTSILWRYWYVRGYIREWEEHLTAALELAPIDGPLRDHRAKALTGAGTLAIWRGEHVSARLLFEESLAIRRELGDGQGIAAALNNLGVIAGMQGDYASAQALYEESLSIKRLLADENASTANLLHNLGELANLQGNYASAQAFFEESLAMRRAIGSKEGTAHALRELGMVLYRQGDADSARPLLEESLSIQREIGDKMGATGALSYLGSIACDQGDYASARARFVESLIIRREIGVKSLIAGSLADLGQLAAKVGEAYRGTSLLGAASYLWEAMNRVPSAYAREIFEDGVACARAQLAEETFAEAWEDGRTMSVESAVALALGEAPSQT